MLVPYETKSVDYF